jgi:hypothetical protein
VSSSAEVAQLARPSVRFVNCLVRECRILHASHRGFMLACEGRGILSQSSLGGFMPISRSYRLAFVGLVATILAAVAVLPAGAASSADPRSWTNVPSANPKADGLVTPDLLSPQLVEVAVAQGATKLENATTAVPFYGYDGDQPALVPLPTTPTVEAHKTEPDENTYLVFRRGLNGADPGYNYGTHFLFQGHESHAPGTPGYITRINLDADQRHRVTLLATQDLTGADLPNFDGSTWDPFACRLLLTSEGGNSGGVWQASLAVPSKVEDISGLTGRGGYEDVQNDNRGNLYLVEDVGGAAGASAIHAKQPNSFVYRVLPTNPSDLTKGGSCSRELTNLLVAVDGCGPSGLIS